MSVWSDQAKVVIEKVIQSERDNNPDITTAALEAKVRDAYPFGERRHHPYRVWLSEVQKRFPQKPTPEHVKNFWIQ